MASELTPEQNERIREALAEGRKIEAIKVYREATGCGLREAKEFIEALIPRLKEQEPEKYAKLSEGVGCASAAILFGIGLAAVALVWFRTFAS